MGLIKYNGKILKRNGGLATSLNCCCADCECQGRGFTIGFNSPPALTTSRVNAWVNLLINDLGSSLEYSTGYTLNAVSTCLGIDTLGQLQDAEVIFHMTCCYVSCNNTPNEHCIPEAPGEDLPEGKQVLPDAVQAWFDSNNTNNDYLNDSGNVTCTYISEDGQAGFGTTIICAFSDPVLPYVTHHYDRNEQCCNSAEALFCDEETV